jgi:dihydroxy-acid dehydratase
MVDAATLAKRREALNARFGAHWRPVNRDRKVSSALQAYAAMATSAARGAVRDVAQLKK